MDGADLERPVLEVASRLLGCLLRSDYASGAVTVRLVEVEAYDGENDPGSHAFRGQTPRNAVMFGPAGRAYVYFTYGMHWCLNVVSGQPGRPSAVLIRAGEVIDGLSVARTRRGERASDRDLARGPARLCQAMGVDGTANRTDLLASGPLRLVAAPPLRAAAIRRGPRVGLAAATERPWRFWIDGDPWVSAYRPHLPRRR